MEVQAKVLAAIAALAPAVEEQAIAIIVNREAEKRAVAIAKCIDYYSKTQNDLRKIKPDVISYDADGKITNSSYSHQMIENKKKLDELSAKLTKAVEKALEDGDYSNCFDLAGKSGGNSKPDDQQSSN